MPITLTTSPPGRAKVLVTGAGGQLGKALCQTAPADVDCRGLARADCDIADPDTLGRCLDATQPSVLINAAAYTAVDRAESEVAEAMRGNAEAPAVLAGACAERGIRLLHVSTDFVFDGERSSPYPPDATPSPIGVYGRSKRDGERAVQTVLPSALILRTGWVYAAWGHNFLLTMLRLHRERDELAVVADQVGTPTAATSLAAALWAAAERPALSGVYHWSDAGACSWYDFAVAIGEEAEALGLIEKAAAVRPIRTIDYPTPARRPAYSVLDKTDSWADFAIAPRHWRAALRDVLGDLQREAPGGTAQALPTQSKETPHG